MGVQNATFSVLIVALFALSVSLPNNLFSRVGYSSEVMASIRAAASASNNTHFYEPLAHLFVTQPHFSETRSATCLQTHDHRRTFVPGAAFVRL